MKTAEILRAAADLVEGARARQHGDTVENFTAFSRFIQAYLAGRNLHDAPLTAEDGAVIMALLKISRMRSGVFNIDDHLDGAAYLAIAGECRAAAEAVASAGTEGALAAERYPTEDNRVSEPAEDKGWDRSAAILRAK